MMETFLKEEKLRNFLDQWSRAEETVLAEKISLGDREIFPLYKISVLCNLSGEIVSVAIDPLLWLVLEEEQRYIVLFDEEEMEKYSPIFDLFDLIPSAEQNAGEKQ